MTAQPRVMMALILVLLTYTSVVAGSTVGTRAGVPVSVFTCLHCDGDHLSQAQTFPSGWTDATIEFYIDDGVNPLPNIPVEDIWISSPDLLFCLGTSIADFPTDANGYTEISGPLCGGGVMEIPSLQGFVSGTLITPANPIPFIQVNSPDLDTNRIHTLNDIARFATLYYNTVYDYDIDYDFDGWETLLDVVIFITHYGHSTCP